MSSKVGRPSVISYEQFVETWKQLIEEGRAKINAVQEILGGSKSTIISFREKFEQDEATKKISWIQSIELPEAIHHAIAAIKIKELSELGAENTALKARLNECIAELEKSEKAFITARTTFDERKTEFKAKEKEFDRQLAASEARRMDAEKNEHVLIRNLKEQSEQLNQYREEAAVAKKEVAMLRERLEIK